MLSLFFKSTILCMVILISSAKYSTAAIVGYDDFGRKIVMPNLPERVVLISATPIATIFELGAGDRIVGVPDSIFRSYLSTVRRYPSLLKKPLVGGVGNPNIEKIISLAPDLIICFDSMDSPGKHTRVFERYGIPYASFGIVKDVKHGLEQIRRLGILLGKEKEAKNLTRQI